MEKSEIKGFIAKRVAQELKDGDVVNLGIGLPTLVPAYLPEGVHVILQSENGIIGTGAKPTPEEADPRYKTDAGGQPAQVYYMSRDGVPAAHGALNMMLIAVCYQVVVIGYALAVALLRFDLVANLGGGLGLLLLFGAVVNGALTAGMLCLMFLPNAARRLTGGVLSLLVRVRLVRRPEEAREKLEKQMEEYRRGADCVRRNPALVPALLGLTFCQLTALFSVPLVVYHAFGLTGSGALDIIGTQALVTLAVASLPLPGAVGASEGGFVAAMRLFFGAGLVTPAVLVSRGISFYSFLLLSGCVTLLVHLRTRNRQPVAVSPRLPKTARGTVVT